MPGLLRYVITVTILLTAFVSHAMGELEKTRNASKQ